MATASVGRPDVAAALVEKIPPIVDLDAHVVEPPDLWTFPSAREVPRRRPARRVPAGRHAEVGGRRLHRGARHGG